VKTKRDANVTGGSEPPRPEALGVSDPETGELGRNVAGRPLAIPKQVWIDGDLLRWSWGDPDLTLGVDPPRGARFSEQVKWIPHRRCRLTQPTRTMLRDFVNLADARDEKIRSFASRWGPLGICEHDLPHTHWPRAPWIEHLRNVRFEPVMLPSGKTVPQLRSDLVRAYCSPRGTVETFFSGGWEPMSIWRRYSRAHFGHRERSDRSIVNSQIGIVNTGIGDRERSAATPGVQASS
jgi:hypothetical protein